MPARATIKDIDTYYKQAIQSYIGLLEEAIEDLENTGGDAFREALTVGINRLHVKSSEIATGILVSKGAVSKWLSGHATPNLPTRRVTYMWLLDRARLEVEKL